MKKTRFFSMILVLVAIISFVFGGCDMGNVFDSGIEDLMQPPMPDEEKYQIKLLLDTLVSGTVTFCAPKSGDYRMACTEYDINGDGNDEAILFYQEKLNGVTTLYIHFFRKNGNKWINVNSIPTEYDDLYSVDFYDLNNDGSDEVLVMWENEDWQSTKKTLAIYDCADDTISLGAVIGCEYYTVVDLQPDNIMDLITFVEPTEIGSVAKAEIYQYGDEGLGVPLTLEFDDPDIQGFASVVSSPQKLLFYPSFADDERILKTRYFPRVLVDCYYPQNQLITYVIYANKEIEAEFDEPVFLEPTISAIDKEMLPPRESTIMSMDINNDGVVDLPTLAKFANTYTSDPTGLIYISTKESLIVWHTYAWHNPSERKWVTSEYTVFNSEFNYTLTIPEKWVLDIALIEDSSKNEYVFEKWSENKEKLGVYFRVRVFKAYDWKKNEALYTGNALGYKYEKIATNEAGTLVYALSAGDYGMPNELIFSLNQ